MKEYTPYDKEEYEQDMREQREYSKKVVDGNGWYWKKRVYCWKPVVEVDFVPNRRKDIRELFYEGEEDI